MIENRLGPRTRQVWNTPEELGELIVRAMEQPSDPERIRWAKKVISDFNTSKDRGIRTPQPRPRRAAAGSHLSVSQLKAKARDLRRDCA